MLANPRSPNIRTDFGGSFSASSSIGSQDVVASGAANTKGSWVELEASTDYAVNGFHVFIFSAAVSGTSVRGVFDIGVGAVGNEKVIVPDYMVSTGDFDIDRPMAGIYFPMYIPSGTRVSMRTQSSAGVVNMTAWILFNYGSGITPIFRKCEALGITTASATQGVTVTSGAGAYGSYATVATTTKDYKALQPCVGISTATATTSFTSIGVGISSADIFRRGYVMTSYETISAPTNPLPFFGKIPSGTALQARAWCASAMSVSVGLHAFY